MAVQDYYATMLSAKCLLLPLLTKNKLHNKPHKFLIAGGPYLISSIMKILILYNEVPICMSVSFILY